MLILGNNAIKLYFKVGVGCIQNWWLYTTKITFICIVSDELLIIIHILTRADFQPPIQQTQPNANGPYLSIDHTIISHSTFAYWKPASQVLLWQYNHNETHLRSMPQFKHNQNTSLLKNHNRMEYFRTINSKNINIIHHFAKLAKIENKIENITLQ